MTKKMFLIFCSIFLTFIIFSIIVIVAFNSISNNRVDAISMTHIRNYTDISEQYGEIISIGKNIIYETEQTDNAIRTPYTVQTLNKRVIVYVTLENIGDDWKVVSTEIVEVIEDDN